MATNIPYLVKRIFRGTIDACCTNPKNSGSNDILTDNVATVDTFLDAKYK